MAEQSRLFHESWYRIADQRISLRASVRVRRQLYRGAPDLPLIVPGLVWDHADDEGRPKVAPEQVVPAVRIPRTYVFDEL